MLRGQVIVHEVLPRYQRVLLGTGRGSARRYTIWTSPRSIDSENRHEQMRQRQEAWKRKQKQLEHQAAQRRAEEAAATLAEAERQREIRAAEDAVLRAERERLWAIEAEQARLRREAEEQRRQEQEEAARQERLRQEEREREIAHAWWQEISLAQREELLAAVADLVWKTKKSGRLEFDEEPTREHAYGVAIHQKTGRYGDSRELYGVLRPSPASLYRLPAEVSAFVRNAREARQLTATGNLQAERVVHFDLPDGEQLSLL